MGVLAQLLIYQNTALTPLLINKNSREATPGGKGEAADGGAAFVAAETVANNSLSRTRTQPDRTGNTALCFSFHVLEVNNGKSE